MSESTRLTGNMLGQLLEAAASGCECVELSDGQEVEFAEDLRTIAGAAYERGDARVGLKIRLSFVDDEGYEIEGDDEASDDDEDDDS